MQLDYTLKTPEERIKYVEQLLNNSSEDINSRYLSYLSDYILFINDKNQTKKEKISEHPILTRNREATIDKRQISYEEIVSTLKDGEDGIYALITNDKNVILDPKEKISDKDIEEVPGLREQLDLIPKLTQQFEQATGARKYSLKKQIIETWQQIYILRASFRNSISSNKMPSHVKSLAHLNIPENVYIGEDTLVHSDAILTLLNPNHISFLLCYYPQLKQECIEDLNSDMHFLLMDLEQLAEDALLSNYPMLYDLLVFKIDGLSNEEIRKQINAIYGEDHSEQYYSTVWRKRIPKLMADEAQKQYLIWYYTNIEKGKWKKCGECGQIKLAHNMFFAKNSTKDGFYSKCKECKNKRK